VIKTSLGHSTFVCKPCAEHLGNEQTEVEKTYDLLFHWRGEIQKITTTTAIFVQ